MIALLGGVGFIFLYEFGCLAYAAFHTTSNFDELIIKKAELLNIRECKYQRAGRSYVLATMKINDKIEDYKLPCGKDVTSLGNEIGNTIEIGVDPRHLSLFTNNLNVWHISSGKKLYYSYDEAFKKYGIPSTHAKNVLYIICIITIAFYAKYHKDIHLFPCRLFNWHGVVTGMRPDTLIYHPSNFFLLSCLLMFSYIAIPTLYYGIFVKRMFLLIAVPLLVIILPMYNIVRKNRCEMVLLDNGLKCESFKRILGRTILEWDDITDLKRGAMHRSADVLYINLKKCDVENSVIINLFRKYTCDLTISGNNFHNGSQLIEAILCRFNLHRAGKSDGEDDHASPADGNSAALHCHR